MCGRYAFYTDRELREIKEMLRDLSEDPKLDKLKSGEIFPTDYAPVLIWQKERIIPILYRWGYPGFQGKGFIINARSETVQERPLFRNSFQNKRCVIPTTGFFEWSREKHKYFFQQENSPMLYLAGLYQQIEGENRYVILTTKANDSVSHVHERMPLVLPEDHIHDWISNREYAVSALTQVPHPLTKYLVETTSAKTPDKGV